MKKQAGKSFKSIRVFLFLWIGLVLLGFLASLDNIDQFTQVSIFLAVIFVGVMSILLTFLIKKWYLENN